MALDHKNSLALKLLTKAMCRIDKQKVTQLFISLLIRNL